MTNIADIRRRNLAFLIETFSLGEVATRVGKPASQVNDMRAGRKSFGEKVARNMEAHWQRHGSPINLDATIQNDVMPDADTDPKIEERMVQAVVVNPQDRPVLIPQFDTGGAMGHGVELRDQPGVIQNVRVTWDWLDRNVRNFTAKQNLCIVTGFGDSMRPLFNPGDPLLLDAGVKSVEIDAVYFFRIGNEGFIKRLQRVPGAGLTAISENKAYKEWTISPDMDFEVFGRILKAWRSEDL